jgi:hypothetical protein
MPPAALMSSTACSAPSFICSPKAAYWPVIGPAVAITISACAAPANRPSAAAVPSKMLIRVMKLPFVHSRLPREPHMFRRSRPRCGRRPSSLS